jgi:PD-(D/E)XK endonuclease
LPSPGGDSERYDFIVDAGSRFWRVQIKATATRSLADTKSRPPTALASARVTSPPDDIDLFAAYILPLDVWYFVPADALPPSASLRFYPHRRARHARFEQYRDAWHYLLLDPRRSSGDLEWFLYPARFGDGAPVKSK